MARAFSGIAASTVAWRSTRPEHKIDGALTVLEADEEWAETAQVARKAESDGHHDDPACISKYAKVALNCWPALRAAAERDDELDVAIWDVYHHSVAQFVHHASIHGKLDPSNRVALFESDDGDRAFIPIMHHGFPWADEDFSQLKLAKRPKHNDLERYWSEPGLGVSLVAIRRRTKSGGYMSAEIPFSATCILRPAVHDEEPGDLMFGLADSEEKKVAAVLELQDPIRVKQVSYEDRQWDLARDLTAPLAMAYKEIDRDKLTSFLNPGRVDDQSGLRMIEPYQPGKIPLVFVHGLLSDRYTWGDMVNDLRAVPGLNEHYQIWSFQYHTGQPFVRSAAEMRRDLTDIVEHLDPDRNDESLRQMVLVGHSMGGLVSKLQVTESKTAIWDSIASRAVEEIDTSPEIRQVIEQQFFFEPLPCVKRAVFIGTPHLGAKMATTAVGKLGSALVITPSERAAMFKAFIKRNPDVFTGDLSHHLPSSIDLLRPDNAILLAAYKLRVNPEVRLHTIIGTGRELSSGIPGDGVVAVKSARHPGTVSEQLVDATHTELTNHEETTKELVRILTEHLADEEALGPLERTESIATGVTTSIRG